MYPSISGNGIKQLEQTSSYFLSQGNETANVSGCTDISASITIKMLRKMMELVFITPRGYEISESIYEPGMMMGLKFNPNGSKYAILQTDDLNRVGRLLLSTDDNANVIKEIQLNSLRSTN